MTLLALALALATAAQPDRAGGAGARGGEPAYLAELREAARRAELAEDTGWLRLVHYRRRLLGGWESETDGASFFLSPRGKRDPAAELDATLAGFFAPTPAEPEAPPGQPQRPEASHPQCRFPARLAFVAARLGLDTARLPLQRCPRFEEFWRRVAARSVTAVFSSYYLNNPASAFGHTFLRLNKDDRPGEGERLELLDQGVNYSATVDTRNALLYAVKGLAGLFRGEFTARPYFYKVREYADYESRDLWEYDLALTPGEVSLLVAHLWELGGTWFDYWYLTENCSYHVLSALEAAAPRLELLSRVGKITIPSDTLKAIAAEPGLVRAVRWRPSVRTQFEARVATLGSTALDAVERLARDADAGIPPSLDDEERARTLDAAVDLVDVRHGKKIALASDPELLELRQRLMERRSAVPVVSPPLRLAPPEIGGPDAGHGSARLAVAGGAATSDGPVVALEYRLALHDLADPPAGYSPRTQLEFLRLRARWAPREQDLRLDEAVLVDVVSLNSFDRFDRRVSWRFRVGAESLRDGGCAGCLVGRAEIGGGPGRLALGSRLAAMATLDAELVAGPRLAGFRDAALRAGLGPQGLLRVLAGRRASLLATARWRWFPEAAPRNGFALGGEARLHLGPASLALEWRRGPLGHEALLWTHVYR